MFEGGRTERVERVGGRILVVFLARESGWVSRGVGWSKMDDESEMPAECRLGELLTAWLLFGCQLDYVFPTSLSPGKLHTEAPSHGQRSKAE